MSRDSKDRACLDYGREPMMKLQLSKLQLQYSHIQLPHSNSHLAAELGMRWTMRAEHCHRIYQSAEGGHHSNQVGPVAFPLAAGIAKAMQVLEVNVVLQGMHREQTGLADEVESDIKLLQGLATLQVLQFGYIVEGHIQVSKLLQAASGMSHQQLQVEKGCKA